MHFLRYFKWNSGLVHMKSSPAYRKISMYSLSVFLNSLRSSSKFMVYSISSCYVELLLLLLTIKGQSVSYGATLGDDSLLMKFEVFVVST